MHKKKIIGSILVVIVCCSIFFIWKVTHKDSAVMQEEANITITLRNDDVQLSKDSSYQSYYNVKEVVDEQGNILTYGESLTNGVYTVEDNLNREEAGTYQALITAMNIQGQTKTVQFTITVCEDAIDYIETEEEIQAPTYIDGILLVNKQHGLPSDFDDEDAEEAYTALQELQAAALLEDYQIPLLSGYRSYDYQVNLYQSYVEVDGTEAADRYSARPGYSEHQTGLCFDVGEISYAYGETQEGQWLAQHCAEYGFIIRYPEGKEHITGYTYEPWHIRYVGKEAATFIMNENITLEEYLGTR